MECRKGPEVAHKVRRRALSQGPNAVDCPFTKRRAFVASIRDQAELFDQLYLIFLLGARLIVFAEFVFVMRQWISRPLKRYVTEMYGVGRDLYDFL
jgi:hypothetical protein